MLPVLSFKALNILFLHMPFARGLNSKEAGGNQVILYHSNTREPFGIKQFPYTPHSLFFLHAPSQKWSRTSSSTDQSKDQRVRPPATKRISSFNSGVGVIPNPNYRYPCPDFEQGSEMGVNSISSESNIDLDEQISQLMQCKPLSEQQVYL